MQPTRYRAPESHHDWDLFQELDLLVQELGELLREYVRRFNLVRRGIRDIPDIAIIVTFYMNVRDACLVKELATHPMYTLAELYQLVDRCILLEKKPCLSHVLKARRGRGLH